MPNKPALNGFFYLIRLAPDLTPHRVKLGWASDVGKRLRAHRTAAPTCELVQAWPLNSLHERHVITLATHDQPDCTPLTTEAFDVGDVTGLAIRIGRAVRAVTQMTDEQIREMVRPWDNLRYDEQVPNWARPITESALVPYSPARAPRPWRVTGPGTRPSRVKIIRPTTQEPKP